ncbi:MAG TPA: ArgE/DapE family deacylase [Candidatus Limnocylindrales bacterium]|nr:ArgE/DapE family deacylase [Candidatus Limnocylindrales bacterium]
MASPSRHEAAARDAVDGARVAEELAALVAIPSVTGHEHEVQREVARRLADAGLEVDAFEADATALAGDPDFPGMEVKRTTLPVVAGTLRGARPGPRLMLAAHVDVVPPGDAAAWSSPAFEPVVRDGRLFGRGACDMKGGLVAAMEALRALAAVTEGGAELAGEAVLLAVPSEEDGGAGMLAAIRAGYRADAAVITEPTDLRLVIAHAGAITFRLTVSGRAAHASRRLRGVSALEKLIVLHDALAADEAARNAAETRPVMRAIGLPYATSIGIVAGGDWASTVLDRVVAEGRYGVRAGQNSAEAEAELRAVMAAACAGDEWLREHPAQVEITGGRFDSAEIPAEHPLPRSLAAVASDVLGTAPPLAGMPAGTDMRLLAGPGGTPTVIYGPGDVDVAHTADEYVPLQQVTDCARVLAAWLVRGLAVAEAGTEAGAGHRGAPPPIMRGE